MTTTTDTTAFPVTVNPALSATPVIVRFGPCQHRWGYAPTVGSIHCMDCQQSHPHDHPETKAYLAALANLERTP